MSQIFFCYRETPNSLSYICLSDAGKVMSRKNLFGYNRLTARVVNKEKIKKIFWRKCKHEEALVSQVSPASEL